MRKTLTLFLLVVSFFLVLSPSVSAHELYIQVDEFEDQGELRVDIKWGHIRDYVSEMNVEDFQLFVRFPNGHTEQLDLEEAGVYARSYVPITNDGTYTFWAIREKSTYTPDDGDPQLSNHMAKMVYHVGQETSNAGEKIDIELEITPTTSIADFSSGDFSGAVLLNGEPASNAIVTAYGPDWEVLEGQTDEDGAFEFTFDSKGEWLIKANVMEDESGTINGEAYQQISNTSTLLLDTTTDELESSQTNNWSLIAMLVIGLLIGASISLFLIRKK